MRKKHTGQKLDHLFRKLNKATTLQELDAILNKATEFEPQSDYEIKDKKNLIEQITGMFDFM